METVTHDGRHTAYRVADRGAEGPTIAFVHGSGGDRRVWKAQDRLARSHPIVALDLSGHGDSADIETRAGPPTLSAYAADVAAVAEATGAEVLVGNSLGGAVIQWGTLEGTLDPAAAVLVGSGAKLAVADQLRRALADDFEAAIEALHQPGRLLADPDDRIVAASRATMRETGRAVTERDFLSCHTFDVRDRLDAIGVPVLAIGGERDGLTPPSYHAYLARTLPHGVLSIVPDAGHLVMLERPDRFNRDLVAFLAHAGYSSNSPSST